MSSDQPTTGPGAGISGQFEVVTEVVRVQSGDRLTLTKHLFTFRDGLLVSVSEPRESETDRCTAEEFVNRFGLKLAEETQVEVAETPQQTGPGTELMDSEIWHWLAVALIAGLAVEGLVANRTAA